MNTILEIMALAVAFVVLARGVASLMLANTFVRAATRTRSGVRSALAHFVRQSITDTYRFSMVLKPQNGNNNTSYALVSFTLDTRDFDFTDFFIMLGAIDVSIDAKAQECTGADGTGSVTDISGAAITQVGSTSDNRMAVISIRHTTITKRYVQVAVNVPNGTTNMIAIMAAQYGERGNLPVSQQIAGTYTYLTAEVIKV